MTVTSLKLVQTKARWLGIDFFDAVFLIVLFAVINLFTSAVLFDFAFCLVTYMALRIVKATKPNRWFLHVLRYYFGTPYYSVTSNLRNPHEHR